MPENAYLEKNQLLQQSTAWSDSVIKSALVWFGN